MAEQPKPGELQRLAAELIGTFVLTLVAAGADVIDYTSAGEIGHTARYLAPGFAVTAMIWSLSAISGAHINPAVSFAFVVRRSFPLLRAAGYVGAQFLGALAAAATLKWYFADAIAHGATKPGAGISAMGAMTWEAILTAVLILVILGTAEQEAVVGKNAALAIGLTVAMCGLFSSPISGASMNPARSIALQLLSGEQANAWIYLVGPLLGSLAAVAIVRFVVGPARKSEREAAHGKHR